MSVEAIIGLVLALLGLAGIWLKSGRKPHVAEAEHQTEVAREKAAGKVDAAAKDALSKLDAESKKDAGRHPSDVIKDMLGSGRI